MQITALLSVFVCELIIENLFKMFYWPEATTTTILQVPIHVPRPGEGDRVRIKRC